MTVSLVTDNRANATPQDSVTRAGVRSAANVNRVQVRSVNWSELARQVDENTAELVEHDSRITDLELSTERLETRVSATEQTTEELVYLVNEKLIMYNELGD